MLVEVSLVGALVLISQIVVSGLLSGNDGPVAERLPKNPEAGWRVMIEKILTAEEENFNPPGWIGLLVLPEREGYEGLKREHYAQGKQQQHGDDSGSFGRKSNHRNPGSKLSICVCCLEVQPIPAGMR